MSREKRKERRQAKRTRRQMRRQQRRGRIQNIIEQGKELKVIPDDIKPGDYQAWFNHYWPTFRETLRFIHELRITRQKTEKAIEEIIELGNAISNTGGTEEQRSMLQEKLSNVWRFVRLVLNLTTMFTAEKADEVIDKILEIGDWLSGFEDTDEDEESDKLDLVKE